MLTGEVRFLYGVSAPFRRCLTCGGPTFYYTAYHLSWSYCALCRVFYTPNRKREISRFLAKVAQSMEVKT